MSGYWTPFRCPICRGNLVVDQVMGIAEYQIECVQCAKPQPLRNLVPSLVPNHNASGWLEIEDEDRRLLRPPSGTSALVVASSVASSLLLSGAPPLSGPLTPLFTGGTPPFRHRAPAPRLPGHVPRRRHPA